MDRNARLPSRVIDALSWTPLRVGLNIIQREVKPAGTKGKRKGRLAEGLSSTQTLVETRRGRSDETDSHLPVKLHRHLRADP